MGVSNIHTFQRPLLPAKLASQKNASIRQLSPTSSKQTSIQHLRSKLSSLAEHHPPSPVQYACVQVLASAAYSLSLQASPKVQSRLLLRAYALLMVALKYLLSARRLFGLARPVAAVTMMAQGKASSGHSVVLAKLEHRDVDGKE